MAEVKLFPPPAQATENAHVKSLDAYKARYKESIEEPEAFWAKEAERLHWFKPWDNIREYDFVKGEISWFEGGKLNVSYNCLDRHVNDGHGDETALIWEGNDPNESSAFTYNELLAEVQKFANVLKSLGVKKGDRVCMYMQMISQLPVAMLACARIGAVHSIVFGAFSAESLRDRINDSACKILITQDSGVRGTKQDIPMKINADEAVAQCPSIEHVVVVRRTDQEVNMQTERDHYWDELMATAEPFCEAEQLDAEDPLFILYTSGSTGKPKGVLHTTGGYLLYTAMTHELIFDYQPGDIYWCTADIGWITGHSYIVYGPMANRAITMMYEGVPNYPDYGRFWQIVEKHKVTQFYTAPTAIRALMKEGDRWPNAHDLSSVRILGTVGEPIKEPEWMWYHKVIGKENCPIVDTWWQTETGGVLITPLPAATATKPGSATLPFYGIEPVLLDESGNEIEGPGMGYLAIKTAWPSIMRTVYGDHDRFLQTYFSRFPGYYFTGDGAKRD
ncbi:MAG: acetate--CoA ligase, partial [Calditrichaeota bacterium]